MVLSVTTQLINNFIGSTGSTIDEKTGFLIELARKTMGAWQQVDVSLLGEFYEMFLHVQPHLPREMDEAVNSVTTSFFESLEREKISSLLDRLSQKSIEFSLFFENIPREPGIEELPKWMKKLGPVVFRKNDSSGETLASRLVQGSLKSAMIAGSLFDALGKEMLSVPREDLKDHCKELSKWSNEPALENYFEKLVMKVHKKRFAFLDSLDKEARVEEIVDLIKKEIGLPILKVYLTQCLQDLEMAIPFLEKTKGDRKAVLFILDILFQNIDFIDLIHFLREVELPEKDEYIKKVVPAYIELSFPEDVSEFLCLEKGIIDDLYTSLHGLALLLHEHYVIEKNVPNLYVQQALKAARVHCINATIDIILNEGLKAYRSDLVGIFFEIDQPVTEDNYIRLETSEGYATSFWHDLDKGTLKMMLDAWTENHDHMHNYEEEKKAFLRGFIGESPLPI